MAHTLSLDEVRTADAASHLNLENQKNGVKEVRWFTTHRLATLRLTQSGPWPGWWVRYKQTLPESTPLGTYTDNGKTWKRIQAKDIIGALRNAAAADNLVVAGYELCCIGSHSRWSGGAVNLKLSGYDQDMIKKLGRWSSNTYLHCNSVQHCRTRHRRGTEHGVHLPVPSGGPMSQDRKCPFFPISP